MKVCILKLSAIGDCICVVPAVRALQRQIPGVQITWIISEPGYSLLKGLEGVEFIVIKKPRSLRDYLALRQKFSSLQFDVLLAMQTSMRSNFILPFIKAKRKIGFNKKRSKELQGLFVNERIGSGGQHYVDQYLNFVEAICRGGAMSPPASLLAKDFLLPITDAGKSWAKQQIDPDKKYLVVNPAASTAKKTWLPERYREVIRQVHDKLGYEIIITGGPGMDEKQLADEIITGLGFPVINFTGKNTLDLKKLAALFEVMDVVLAPDTGPMHLADAMGAKVVGLFAVTNPSLSGPYHNLSNAVSIYSKCGNMQEITAAMVVDQLTLLDATLDN